MDCSTPWVVLYKEYYDRFVPGKEDLEVLRRAHGCPTKWVLETFATPETRRSNIPDPTAGLQPRWDVGVGGAEREPEELPEFSRYVIEFGSMSRTLHDLRKPWLDIASREDPMKWDEAEVRYVEGEILRDLLARGVSANILRQTHCLSSRKYASRVGDDAPGYEKSCLLYTSPSPRD